MVKLIEKGRTFSLHGAVFDALAAPSTGSRETAAWRVTLAPGAAGATHAVTREEIFVAVQGSARVRCGGQTLDLHAGGALVVPPDTPFSLSNESAHPFCAVAVLPVGGQAVLADGSLLSPPWAQ